MCFTVLAGCSSSDDDPAAYAAGEYGRPARIRDAYYENERYHIFYDFTYEGRKLTRFDNGTIYIDFEYEKGEIVAIKRYSLTPEFIDSPGGYSFKRQGRYITVTSTIYELHEEEWSLYDSGKVSILTIELDSWDRAVKITDMGVFEYDSNGELQKTKDGINYHVFSYNRSGSVSKQDIYKPNGDLVESYTFEYDGKPGITSKIDLPVWYRVYSTLYSNHYPALIWTSMLCYAENVLKKYSSDPHNMGSSYHYEYYDNDYPKSLSSMGVGTAWYYQIEYLGDNE